MSYIPLNSVFLSSYTQDDETRKSTARLYREAVMGLRELAASCLAMMNGGEVLADSEPLLAGMEWFFSDDQSVIVAQFPLKMYRSNKDLAHQIFAMMRDSMLRMGRRAHTVQEGPDGRGALHFIYRSQPKEDAVKVYNWLAITPCG